MKPSLAVLFSNSGPATNLCPDIVRLSRYRVPAEPSSSVYSTVNPAYLNFVAMFFSALCRLPVWLSSFSDLVPPKTASEGEQEEFKAVAGRRARELGKDGYATFVEDEAAVGMSQEPGYGWRPTGGRDTIPRGFSKKTVSLLGVMGKDTLYVRMADSANSDTFKELLEDVRRIHPKFYMVLDNASYHHSHTVSEYVAGTGGDIELEFLPPRTPQLNQIENVWRDLKKRLAGRYFKSPEDLKAAITAILEKEMGNRLVGYLVD